MRERLGLSPEGLAAELNLTPGVIVAWEAGRIAPSRRAERWLVWRTAMLDRDEALAAAGLPECGALRQIVAETRDAPASRRGDAVLAHMGSCATCLARKQYLEQRFPPMPQPPLPIPLMVLVWGHRAFSGARQWLRTRPWLGRRHAGPGQQ
jgi:hypothetical protein